MENLPPGFRFFPTEEELVAFYLYNKLHVQTKLTNAIDRVIPVIDINTVEPWNLPSTITFSHSLTPFSSTNKVLHVSSWFDTLIILLSLMKWFVWFVAALAGELCRGDTEQWFFFSPGQEREARGGRPSRTTACGYWKATGSPGYVYSSDNTVIGVKKTMVFYKGKAPSGKKTKWKMNEYRAIQLSNQSTAATPQVYIYIYIIITFEICIAPYFFHML